MALYSTDCVAKGPYGPVQGLGSKQEQRQRTGARQLGELVVGFQAAQQAAELVVVGVQGQALLRPQDLPRPLDKVVQEPAPLCVADE